MMLTRRLLLGSSIVAFPSLRAEPLPKLAIAAATGERWTLVQRTDQVGTHLQPSHQDSFPADDIGLDALCASIAAELAQQAGLPAERLLPFKLDSQLLSAGPEVLEADPARLPESLNSLLTANAAAICC